MGQPMWDERYRGEEYVYGTSPNDFLRSQIATLPRGRILCLAEGEGRNAVFLAEQGYDVTAVDQSPVGLAKARQLAEQRGVSIETVVADLAAFEVAPEAWDGVVSIFAHVPPPARQHIHRQVVTGLRPGGVLLLEAYRPEQLEYRTGGPPVAELMMTLDGLREELSGLDFDYCAETVRDIQEGPLHHGAGAVVQLRARRPH
ncbi:MAG TPA: class I SAM-dependent methyltransferase [Mycobacterium sp.]|nr:class I SAM-dependent methyltransferase [Mycobacterium sp.]HQC77635.1 class I SAM-dependent methyltransferase [Mycobacterium sp.]